jgi:hypothetical protein
MLSKGLIYFIKLYSVAVSPLFAGTCRFSPTCSAYAMEAVETHGTMKGLRLAIKRLLKCHPWHRCNTLIDPVPKVGYKTTHDE